MQTELLTVEDIREQLDKTEKGKTRQSIQNTVTVLRNDPMLKGTICRNEMSGLIDICRDLPWKRRGSHMTDTDLANIHGYLEKVYGLTSDNVIGKGITIVSNENSYHPVKIYLESLQWDGEERIAQALPRFLKADDIPYTAEVLKMHMLAAICRLYHPGVKYDIMLCLIGEQGTGKSTFFRYLAIKDEWFTDSLDNLGEKSAFEKLQGHWIIEMGEMNAIANAKSIEGTKAFLSRQKDTFRIPYEKYPEDRPRQCVFCGTSNEMAFLPLDRTGNRRFAPVLIHLKKGDDNIVGHEQEIREYIIQMWAEAMEIYRSGNFLLTFTPEMEEYVKNLQVSFMPEDIQAGMIQAFLDNYQDDYVCTTIIYQKVLGQNGLPEKWKSKEIGDIMDNSIEGWMKHGNHRFGGNIGTQRSWKRIDPLTDKNGFMKVPDAEQMEIPFD